MSPQLAAAGRLLLLAYELACLIRSSLQRSNLAVHSVTPCVVFRHPLGQVLLACWLLTASAAAVCSAVDWASHFATLARTDDQPMEHDDMLITTSNYQSYLLLPAGTTLRVLLCLATIRQT